MSKSVHTRPYREMVAALVAARKSRGVSQVALARATGRTQAYISKVELCERRLDLIEFLEVAHALDIRPGDFVERIYAAFRGEMRRRKRSGRK